LEADQVLRIRAGCLERFDDVGRRLVELLVHRPAGDLAIRQLRGLPRQVDRPPCLCDHRVGEAGRRRQRLRINDLMRAF